MKSKFKSIIIYLFYIGHFIAVIYFGARQPNQLVGWNNQQKFSISVIPIGIILLVPAFWELGMKKSLSIKYSGLVSTGSYAVIRNPQILGWFIILFGISLYLDSLISLLLTFVLWLFFKTILQPMEERKLTHEYGEKYRSYKRKTMSGI